MEYSKVVEKCARAVVFFVSRRAHGTEMEFRG
jgi:hypothetical protein